MHIGFWWEIQKERELLRRHRHRWVDNIKMNLGETEWGGIDWIDLAKDKDQSRAIVNTAMIFRVP
jgi:hypothetical protein